MTDKKLELNLLVTNRDYTLVTSKGHTIEFKKGVATHVPRIVYEDALAIGAIPPDDNEAVDVTPKPAEPTGEHEDRPAKIAAAVEEVVTTGDREAFTASGKPTVGAVSDAAGFKVSAAEVGEEWQRRADAAAAEG